jgi:hypothetical protein
MSPRISIARPLGGCPAERRFAAPSSWRAAAGGGFLLDFGIPAFATGEGGAGKSATLNAYIRIMPNGETSSSTRT